ncbi:helix-turn-helix domain-containing protein [Bacillus coreaensis]
MLKVLIVDDERLEREALRKVLLGHSNQFVIMGEASSGDDALLLIRNMNPDVVILDEKMPGMSSEVATELIKKDFRDLSIILMREYSNNETSKYGTMSLRKPIRPTHLLAILEKLAQDRESPYDVTELLEKLLQRIREEDYKESKELVGRFIDSNQKANWNKDTQKSFNTFSQNLRTIYIEKNIDLPPFFQNNLDGTSFDKASALLYEWIEDLFTKIINQNKPEDRKQIQGALNYIEKNYQRGVTLEEVAEHVHLSPHYLSRLFKKELNINFVNYVSERRINLAKEMLEKTDMPVINIALELSYHEPNYFSKVFKKSTGMTPSEYRRQIEDKGKNLLKRNYYIPNGKWYI